MNKKLFGILCIGLLALTAIPVVSAAADSDLNVTIKRGIGYGIKVTIENTNATDTFHNVNCTILVTKSILAKRVVLNKTYTLGDIEAGNSTLVAGKLKLLSLGFIKVSVTVTSDDLSADIVKPVVKGFDLFGFVHLRKKPKDV